MLGVLVRRTDIEGRQSGDYYDGINRYYDHNLEYTVVKIMTGDCYITTEEREMLVTVLGSCISVCARDVKFGVGGMNHILLPGLNNRKDEEKCTRYGAFAMEELLNGIYKNGGKKENLEIKIFGGGNVLRNVTKIGDKNIKFVKEFLEYEKIPIISEHVGGNLPRRIHYYVNSGKVMMRQLKRKADTELINRDEKEYGRKLIIPEQKVELF